jgi:antitoxin CcdA
MRMARKSLQDPPRRFRGPEQDVRPSRRNPGPKKAVNVSVDAELLKIAKETGINISRLAEDALRKATEPERIRRWREENRDVIESYNAYIERNGIFGEELLEFEDDSPV